MRRMPQTWQGLPNSSTLRFRLIGHSMGGLVSLVYTATYSGRIRALIIVDSTLRMPEDVWPCYATSTTDRGVDTPPIRSFSSTTGCADGTTAAPEIIRHLAERGGRQLPDGTWTHKFDRNVYAQRNSFDGIPHCRKITIPTSSSRAAAVRAYAAAHRRGPGSVSWPRIGRGAARRPPCLSG